MDIYKENEKEIREGWFNEHIAELTQHGELQVLNWHKPNSCFYYCRYIFDGLKLYISGDIGEAVFCFTEKASLEKISQYDLQYFHGKLSALDSDKYSFDDKVAKNRIDEAIKEAKENMDYDEIDVFDDINNEYIETKYIKSDTPRNKIIDDYIITLISLSNEAPYCSNKGHWDYEVYKQYDDLTDYDTDVAEWIFNCGDIIPMSVQGYLVGLKMAYEQLKSQNYKLT